MGLSEVLKDFFNDLVTSKFNVTVLKALACATRLH